MSRIVGLVGGAILVVLGILWTLQGLDVIGGSGMSGHTVWAVVGPIVALVGLYVLFRAARTPATRQDP